MSKSFESRQTTALEMDTTNATIQYQHSFEEIKNQQL